MSTLAFDKNGKPFTFARNTRKLLVRFFPNSGGRGTCVAMLDDSGEQLYVDADTDYLEFRKAVRNQPGLYRLDQCDEDGNEIDDVTPAYVSIGSPRNAAGPSDEVNALAIVRDLASINAEVSKTIADRFAAVMEKTASILDSAAGAGILDRRLAALAELDAQRAKAKHEEDEEDDEDEEEDKDDEDEEEDEAPKDPWAQFAPIYKMVEPHLPQLGALLFAKLAELVSKKTTTPPAVAPNPAPAPAPAPTPPPPASPGQGTEPVGATAGSSATPQPQPPSSATAPTAAANPTASTATAPPTATAPTTATPPMAATAPTTATPPMPATAPTAAPQPTTEPQPMAATMPTTATPPMPATVPMTATAPTTATTTATTAAPAPAEAATLAPAETPPEEVRNALPMPTSEQWTHLQTIRARLSPKEAAIAENVITRMSPDVLVGWLNQLSSLSVDDAVQRIRSTIAELRPPRSSKRE